MSDPTPPPRPRRRRRLPLILIGAAVLLGAVIATVTVVALHLGQARHRYDVSVFLSHDATTAQKDAIRTKLDALHPVGGIRFEDRQQAYAEFKKDFKDYPDLVDGTRPDSLPESFRLTSSGTQFDCSALNKVRHLPGVDKTVVVGPPAHGHPGAEVEC